MVMSRSRHGIFGGRFLEILLGIADEFFAATVAAKEIRIACVFRAMRGFRRIDGHAADWIGRFYSFGHGALWTDTLQGYSNNAMRENVKQAASARLARIEGQVRGVARMIAGDRYCIDVLNQIEAIKAALKKLEDEILKDHIAHCVEHSIASGDPKDQRKKVAELVEILGRITS
jgi:DNA-binding FrmR family transcriptional regulator